MHLSTTIADRLAARSSRRHVLRLAGGTALGTGLALTGSGVALATTEYACLGCPGGSTCHSPAPPCSNCPDGCFGGGCGSGCSIGGSWTVCSNCCKIRCLECCCSGSGCYCFEPLPYACCPGHICPC
jgi:hypothetical protein